ILYEWGSALYEFIVDVDPMHSNDHGYTTPHLPIILGGVKFSADEGRELIELQGEFGNKWARIATYLLRRTDNDVKNFWSSRQKRVARVL
ncbi:Myb-like HTH transcriptional regulator family protein, partial [Tanacetum coccineum]